VEGAGRHLLPQGAGVIPAVDDADHRVVPGQAAGEFVPAERPVKLAHQLHAGSLQPLMQVERGRDDFPQARQAWKIEVHALVRPQGRLGGSRQDKGHAVVYLQFPDDRQHRCQEIGVHQAGEQHPQPERTGKPSPAFRLVGR